MINSQNSKQFDLEERTFEFAKTVRAFLKQIPKSDANREDSKQLIRSSGSIGANYIEANESFSKKDYFMRVKISRKETKESIYWLSLLDLLDPLEIDRKSLIQEATELMRIFGAIISKNSKV